MSAHPALLPDLVHIINQVISIDIDPATIGDDTTIVNDLVIDSISLVSLVALCEEHFGIDLSTNVDAIADLVTVGDALGLIDSALARKAEAVSA